MGAQLTATAMTLEAFSALFRQALEMAARTAEAHLGRVIPRRFEIVLYGAGRYGTVLDPDGAVAALYVGPDRFFRIIDVAVTAVAANKSTVFVRASGHEPASFEKTWNDPPGQGPFKQLLAKQIREE